MKSIKKRSEDDVVTQRTQYKIQYKYSFQYNIRIYLAFWSVTSYKAIKSRLIWAAIVVGQPLCDLELLSWVLNTLLRIF